MKAERSLTASNEVPSFQIRSVESHSTTGREEEGKKEMTGRILHVTVLHGDMDCGQNSFKLVWRCYQIQSGFLANGHLSRVSRQSSRSLMIRVIM